jgi:endogenous inhibitor of DNA gyrase (YacG/DUF329 family)
MTLAARALCVYCRKKAADAQWRPFCSKRCQQLDLARWVDGDYRVPSEPVAPEVLEPAPADSEEFWPDDAIPAPDPDAGPYASQGPGTTRTSRKDSR